MATGQKVPQETMATGQKAPQRTIATGQNAPQMAMATGQTAPKSIRVFPEGQKLTGDNSLDFIDKEFSDITIVVGNDKFPVHKVTLAKKSEGFKTWFNQNPDKKEMTISETTSQAFRILLKYIYTGVVTIPSENELILQLLTLARQYSLKELSSSIVEKLDNILDTENVIFFLNGANDHDLEELRDACHLLVDDNIMEILSSDSFSSLSQKSLIHILERDTFLAPEIEIFKSVAKWCEKNNNPDSLVLECIRFAEMSVSEIIFTVRPTNLVNSDKLVEIISEIMGASPKKLDPRSLPEILTVVDVNVATVDRGAQLVSQLDTAGLLSGNRDVNKTVRHVVDGKNSIIVRLKQAHYLNHIRMRLYDLDDRRYSYYIETSMDQRNWHRIIDYTRYPCRSVQNLYFDQQTAQYIKIVGTTASVGNDFHLVFFEAFYKTKIPKVIDGVTRPEKNIVTRQDGAKVIQGQQPERLLDENFRDYTYHTVGDGKPIIIQLGQPYLISTMKFLLFADYKYKYYVETSVNGTDWEIVVDRRNVECTSFQYLQFAERVVIFIKTTGTYSSFNPKWFICSSFECASDSKK